MSNAELRALILAEMKRRKAKDIASVPSLYAYRGNIHEYCTWWFKFKVPFTTKVIRAELERMERDGLVASDRSQSNNTRWILTDKAESK